MQCFCPYGEGRALFIVFNYYLDLSIKVIFAQFLYPCVYFFISLLITNSKCICLLSYGQFNHFCLSNLKH